MRIALVLTCLVALTGSTAAQAALPQFPRDTDYGRARQLLQRQGWQPVLSPGAEICQGGDARCRGRPEMLACAGTGLANCVFTWQRGSAVIEVHTIGEGPVTVQRVRCRASCG